MAILEKETARFIEEMEAKKAKPLYKLTPQEARRALDELQMGPCEKPAAQIEDLALPAGPQGKLSVRIVRPSDRGGKLPVLVYFHGGGWVLGNKETHDRLVRELTMQAHVAVVFVNYTPSPEARASTILEECVAATLYLLEHGEKLGLDPTRLAVAGDSAGGTIAAAVTLKMKEKGQKIAAQLLFYPVTDANFKTDSYKEFKNGPWLTKAAMEWFWSAYAPDIDQRKSPLVCPLQASIEELKNLPPAFIITAENDVLRDEGEAYAHKLMEAGVDVACIRILGTCHDFMMLNGLSNTPAARNAIQMASLHLQKALQAHEQQRHRVA